MSDVPGAAEMVNAIVCALPEPAGEARFRAACAALRVAAAMLPDHAPMLSAAGDTFDTMADVEAKQGNQ